MIPGKRLGCFWEVVWMLLGKFIVVGAKNGEGLVLEGFMWVDDGLQGLLQMVAKQRQPL